MQTQEKENIKNLKIKYNKEDEKLKKVKGEQGKIQLKKKEKDNMKTPTQI